MTKKELVKILSNFDDNAEVLVPAFEKNGEKPVIDAFQDKMQFVHLVTAPDVNKLASIVMGIIMVTPVSEEIQDSEAFKELVASCALYDQFTFDHYAHMLLNTADDFCFEFPECDLSRLLLRHVKAYIDHYEGVDTY